MHGRIANDGISLLMGNDFVGDKVWSCPMASPCPTKEKNTIDLVSLLPACAVSRNANRRTSSLSKALNLNYQRKALMKMYLLRNLHLQILLIGLIKVEMRLHLVVLI